jgi:hypothetical protein
VTASPNQGTVHDLAQGRAHLFKRALQHENLLVAEGMVRAARVDPRSLATPKDRGSTLAVLPASTVQKTEQPASA